MLRAMDFFSQISCGHCGKSHRIRKSLRKRAKYRFSCKRCGAVVTFNLSCVRWAYEPEVPCNEQRHTLPGAVVFDQTNEAPLDMTSQVELEPERPARPAPPPVPAPPPQPRPVLRDTLLDGRSPLHLSPLLKRGIPEARESSRVRWLRARGGAAT